ncbi:hypothetical protein [Donghicola tyrosinivorans]|uniref:hypothetical protein n=1 Tax=Donghicola tyrosinivorans TaxID=1652492 RepID=UPI0014759C94|nr:hypothetical protein [Donghicola tyrosinivorans]
MVGKSGNDRLAGTDQNDKLTDGLGTDRSVSTNDILYFEVGVDVLGRSDAAALI